MGGRSCSSNSVYSNISTQAPPAIKEEIRFNPQNHKIEKVIYRDRRPPAKLTAIAESLKFESNPKRREELKNEWSMTAWDWLEGEE